MSYVTKTSGAKKGRIVREGISLGESSKVDSFDQGSNFSLTCLVTGATGFIGSHLVESLLQKGFTVRALIRPTSNTRWLRGLGVECLKGDLRQRDFPGEALRDVGYIFHLAGVIQAFSRREYFEINEGGTRRLLEVVRETKPPLKKFVFVSSQGAGGPSLEDRPVREEDTPHPVSFYGASKLAAEKLALDYADKFPVVILRPPTIYGPRETRVFQAFRMMNRGFALTVGSRPKFISFCYVDDLIRAVLQAAFQKQPSGRIYNVSGQRPYEWLEIMEAIARSLGRPHRIFRIPVPAAFLFGAAGEIYSRLTRRSTLFTWQKVKEFVQNSWVIDGTRIREELGWREEVSLQEGMTKTAAWYRGVGWL